MTVRVERSFELNAPPDRVWGFLVDPENRARSISVVRDFTLDDADGREATWHVELPIPFVNRTIAVETRDVTRREPEYVKFVGKSKAMRVTGEHRIVPTEGGCRLENSFVVDGRLPGVEKYFSRNLDDEIENLRRSLEAYLETDR